MCEGCNVCMNADIRFNAFDFLAWRGELGWEQSLGMDMEAAARLSDPMPSDDAWNPEDDTQHCQFPPPTQEATHG